MLDGRRVPAAGENRIGQARSSLGRREERVFMRWKGCGPLHRYLLFDLDGTLTDPAEGITKCVQYALASLGREKPRQEELYCYIGPPLAESFEKYGGFSEQEAQLAVEKYRERYSIT